MSLSEIRACDAMMYSQTIESKYFDIWSPLACGDTADFLCTPAFDSLCSAKRSHESLGFHPKKKT